MNSAGVTDSAETKVGIIRCDTHGYWYAPLFEAPDPEVYRKHHRCCHYYFYRPENPRKLRLRPVPGMTIAKVYDEEDRQKAEGLAEAYGGRPMVCDSFEEVSDGVDLVYVADCNYEGKDHLRYSTPGLRKGVPHFIDKPFAYTLDDARAMIQLAQKHNTAVMSASLLRYAPSLGRFRAQLKNVAPVRTLLVPCQGPSLGCLYHGLSCVQNVLGERCEWVESMGPNLYDVLRLHYPGVRDGIEAIVLSARGRAPGVESSVLNYSHCGYFVSAYGARGSVHSPRVDDYAFPHSGLRIVRMTKRMAQTRTPPIPYASMLELMEMIEAARLAHKTGRRVHLTEVRRGDLGTTGQDNADEEE